MYYEDSGIGRMNKTIDTTLLCGFQVSDIFNIYSTFKLQGYSLDIQLSSYKDIGYIFATYSLHIQYIFNLLSKANM